jgi:uncharacterized SAM-binding protein YcdF (DUF218 family)
MSAEGRLRPVTRWKLRVVWALLGVIAGYNLFICCGIVWQSRQDEAQAADVMVVFGAAEYAGHPSPVFRARLDHAVTLYSRGIAPYLIITGGSGRDPQFSEGGVGRDYLAARGISERHLIAETQGENTAESAERVAVIMRANNMRTCVVVSDPYHLYRIKRLMQRQGITTYASPRPYASHGLWPDVRSIMREAFSYMTQRVRPT